MSSNGDTVLINIGLLCVYECNVMYSSWIQTIVIVMWHRERC
jgi:hypothetical protein